MKPTRSSRSFSFLGPLAIGMALGACAHDPNVAVPAETPTLTGAVYRGPVSNDAALAQMANAR
ncbi:MAG: hypothetical protein U0174_25485 [Polyangiaceae bacterium]